MWTRLARFALNLWLHARRVRPACGCHAFATCDTCPRWKLEAQVRYHEEGAAGLHLLPEHAPGWRYFYDADSWKMRRRWGTHPGGFSGYANGLLQQIRSYQTWQFRLCVAAGLLGGLSLGVGLGAVFFAAMFLGAWAFREELTGPVRRAGRLLHRAWRASSPEDFPLPIRLWRGAYQS